MKTFFIKENYKCRLENKSFDDTKLTDQWQKEVYEFAKNIAQKHNFQNVLDIGTGSGYKLIKYFDHCNTLGIDIPATVEFLRNTYPNKAWSSNFNPIKGYDLIISSDVIEHLPDPDMLLDLIIASSPKLIVLSTPDRSLLYSGDHDGPPYNKAHVREWNMSEFYKYIDSKLQVLEHFTSNRKQSTQVILATLKGNSNALV
jgi:hypothetical protein